MARGLASQCLLKYYALYQSITEAGSRTGRRRDMDPITLSILGAVSAGALAGVTDTAKEAIEDSYEGLKRLIKNKFGSDSNLSIAIDKFEDASDSPSRNDALAKAMNSTNAASDAELSAAAQSLLQLLKALPGGDQKIQQIAHGTGIAQAAGGSTATAYVADRY